MKARITIIRLVRRPKGPEAITAVSYAIRRAWATYSMPRLHRQGAPAPIRAPTKKGKGPALTGGTLVAGCGGVRGLKFYGSGPDGA